MRMSLPSTEGIETEVGGLNAFFNRVNGGGIPRLNHEGAHLGGSDGGEFLEAHTAALVRLDIDVFHEGGRGFAGADAGEFGDDHFFTFLHFLLGIEEDVIDWHAASLGRGGGGGKENCREG